MNEYFDECIKLANKAARKKEVPVGAVVVINNKIIGRGYNKRKKNHLVDGHAEIVAIKQASKRMKDWRLQDCDLYVTLKPCSMCESIIKEARIKNVFYLIEKSSGKKEYNKTQFTEVINNENYKSEYKELLTKFFNENCNR